MASALPVVDYYNVFAERGEPRAPNELELGYLFSAIEPSRAGTLTALEVAATKGYAILGPAGHRPMYKG